jgi:IS1 family transposase
MCVGGIDSKVSSHVYVCCQHTYTWLLTFLSMPPTHIYMTADFPIYTPNTHIHDCWLSYLYPQHTYAWLLTFPSRPPTHIHMTADFPIYTPNTHIHDCWLSYLDPQHTYTWLLTFLSIPPTHIYMTADFPIYAVMYMCVGGIDRKVSSHVYVCWGYREESQQSCICVVGV